MFISYFSGAIKHSISLPYNTMINTLTEDLVSSCNMHTRSVYEQLHRRTYIWFCTVHMYEVDVGPA